MKYLFAFAGVALGMMIGFYGALFLVNDALIAGEACANLIGG